MRRKPTCQTITPASAKRRGSVNWCTDLIKLGGERTPAALLRSGHTGRESRRADVTVVGVTRRLGGLADDKLVQVDACSVDLEDGRLGPRAAGLGEQGFARRVHGGALCKTTGQFAAIGRLQK